MVVCEVWNKASVEIQGRSGAYALMIGSDDHVVMNGLWSEIKPSLIGRVCCVPTIVSHCMNSSDPNTVCSFFLLCRFAHLPCLSLSFIKSHLLSIILWRFSFFSAVFDLLSLESVIRALAGGLECRLRLTEACTGRSALQSLLFFALNGE